MKTAHNSRDWSLRGTLDAGTALPKIDFSIVSLGACFETFMKRKRKIIPVIVVVGLCLSAFFGQNIYAWWSSLIIPEPHIFNVGLSRRTVLKVYPNNAGIFWLGAKWTDDGKYIQVFESRSQVYANHIMMIDPQNPVYNNKIKSVEDGNIFGLVNTLPFTLEDRESLWGACQNENIFFTAKFMDNDLWETRLWKGKQLIKTFPPVEIRFGIYQSGFRDQSVGVTVEFSNFSPDCRYFTIDSYKNTWILDTVNQSFSPLDIHGTQSLFELILPSIGCRQCITPIWSPNSREFVFANNGGIEKYDIVSNKHTRLVAPKNNTGVVKWSKTGNWILGFFKQSNSVISSDGQYIGIIQGCEDLNHPSWSSKEIETYNESASWSPTDDKIAFICNQYGKGTCTDEGCAEEEGFLVVWDLSNLENP